MGLSQYLVKVGLLQAGFNAQLDKHIDGLFRLPWLTSVEFLRLLNFTEHI